jgi:hypothetical protein
VFEIVCLAGSGLFRVVCKGPVELALLRITCLSRLQGGDIERSVRAHVELTLLLKQRLVS